MGNVLTFRIRADKTGPQPAEGEAWPCAGIEVHGDLDGDVSLPTSFIERHLGSDWLEVDEIGAVERPSRPSPAISESGSTEVAVNHRLPASHMPPPHVFRHVDRFVLHTLNLGDVTLRVTHQPDKYVDSDNPSDQVTPELYAAGRTRVDNFYICTVEG